MLPSPQVLADAYRLAVREKAVAAEAAEFTRRRLSDDLIDIPADLEQRVTALTLDSDRPGTMP